jgi:hypothetical protein
MAFSTETGGFGFAVPAPNLAQYAALSQLKPLSFSGGLQSPVQIKPLAGWQSPNTHPEYLAEGINKGLGSIGQGIIAAYKSKQDEKRDAVKFERDKELARIKAELGDPRLEEQIRHNQAMESAALDRIDKVSPSEAKSLSTRSLGGMSMPEPQSSGDGDIGYRPENGDMSYPSLKTGRDLTQPPSDQEFDSSGGQSPEKLNLGKSPLADLTSPQGMEAAPDLRGEAALSALASIPWGKVEGKYKSVGGVPAEPYSPQAPDWLRSPKSVTAPLSKLGGFGDQALPNTDKALSDVESYMGDKQGTNKVMEDAMGVDAIYSEQEAMALRDYARKSGRIEPEIKATQAGYEVNWPKPEVIEAAATRKEASKTRESAAKTQEGLRQQNTLNRESAMFQSHPAVKAFTSTNGMQQSFPRFVKDYDAILKNPEAAGVSDVGLLDMFARAEGGGRVTEGQANLVLGSMGLLDKAKTLGMKLDGGDRLSQNQRDQMLRVIAEDHDAQVKIANQAVEMTRKKLIKQGITDEDSLPQPYITPKTKWHALEEITNLQKQAFQLHEQRKREIAAGNKATADKLKDQIEEIGKNAVEIRKQIDNSKSAIINLHEIENTPQGWTGGAVTTLLQQQ